MIINVKYPLYLHSDFSGKLCHRLNQVKIHYFFQLIIYIYFKPICFKSLKQKQNIEINIELSEKIKNCLRFYFELLILFVVLPRSLLKSSFLN